MVYASDISPLAVLITEMKTIPYEAWDCARIERYFSSVTWKRFAQALHVGDLSILLPLTHQRQILMAFVAATMRTGWEPRSPMVEKDFQRELTVMLRMIEKAAAQHLHPAGGSSVLCADVTKLPFVSERNRQPKVLITSPPFFGSTPNPTRRLFDSVLSPYVRHMDKHAGEWETLYSHKNIRSTARFSELPTNHLLHGFLGLLEHTAHFAARSDCRAVACEMGKTLVDGVEVPFDEILAEYFEAYGYSITEIKTRELPTEHVSVIYAQRRINL
jgi:hypothetical protein